MRSRSGVCPAWVCDCPWVSLSMRKKPCSLIYVYLAGKVPTAMRFPPRSVNGNHIHGTARDHTAAMFHFRSGGQIVPQGFSTVQVSRPHDLVGITHYAESYTHRSTASPGPRSSCTSSTQFWMVRSGPHAERSGPSAPVATRVQLPADAERDRSSVGGAHEPSGTGAQSWRSADISCELPVVGPYVPEQMKFQHADQHPPRTWMNNSGGPIHRCPNCSLYKHDHPPSRFPDKRDAPCPDGGQYAESRGLTQWHPSSSDLAVTPLRGSMQKSRMSPCRSGFLLRALSSGIAAATGDRSRNRYGRRALPERRSANDVSLRQVC